MSQSDAIFLAIINLLKASSNASNYVKEEFEIATEDFSLKFTNKSLPDDIHFAIAVRNFGKVIRDLT